LQLFNIRRCLASAVVAICVATAPVSAQTAKDICGAAPVQPVQNEPPAKIIIDPPLAESLKLGRVVIQYRTENLHTVPVFGDAATAISPRIGHLHISVDDLPWVWMSASGEAVTLNGLPPGQHKVTLHLETPNHHQLDEGSVTFVVPKVSGSYPAVVEPSTAEPPAKIIIDAPLAEPLSRGVIFIRYRTGNLQITPVFGSAALDVSPRVGHVHVTVDDLPWHWEDASGGPVIVNGLVPGTHKVLIQLVNANHQPIDQGTVVVTVPKV
jgi:hypothetical protein